MFINNFLGNIELDLIHSSNLMYYHFSSIIAANNSSQSKLEIMTGCENDIFLVIGPSTDRIVRSNPNIVSNLRKNQLWLYVQNMINVTIIRRTDNSGKNFLEVSLHDVDSFWENTNDEYYAQNKGSNVTHKMIIER